MYLPLRLMNQIESMVTVSGNPRLKSRANAAMLRTSELFWSKSRAEKFVKSKAEWNRARNGAFCIFPNHVKDIETYINSYITSTGLMVSNVEDFLFQNQLYLIRNEWSKNKKVYKIDNDMMVQLCSMKVPNEIPLKAMAFLPSKCFYIDYNGLCPFCKESSGAFITYDVYDSTILWSITNVIDGKRVQCVHTDFALDVHDDTIENVRCSISLSQFREEPVTMTLENDVKITISDAECIRFFINFCLYLYSVNSDVEYTERTRAIYRKKSIVRNTLKEIEEFGVGFKYGKSISASTVKTKYVGEKPKSSGQKRGYSSNYRSAHWHHYWVNDDENPGNKKLIIKWLEGTFVHGNKEDDSVRINKVTK